MVIEGKEVKVSIGLQSVTKRIIWLRLTPAIAEAPLLSSKNPSYAQRQSWNRGGKFAKESFKFLNQVIPIWELFNNLPPHHHHHQFHR